MAATVFIIDWSERPSGRFAGSEQIGFDSLYLAKWWAEKSHAAAIPRSLGHVPSYRTMVIIGSMPEAEEYSDLCK